MRTATLIFCIGLGLSAAQASAQSITWDFANGTDFSRFATYGWVHGTPVPDDLNDRRIVSAIEAQLAAKGLRPAQEKPDVLVTYHVVFGRDLQINATSSDWGSRRWGTNRIGSARVEELLTGTLVVELLDARTETGVWRAIASKEIDAKASPEKRTKNIDRAVEKLFSKYPPAK